MANRTTLVMLHLYKKSCQFAALFFVCVNCLGGNAGEYEWQLPPGFPQPRVPADNPMNLAKVELGRQLFFDTRLSIDNNYACATCHLPERFFTDGRAQAVGVHGDLHPRSSMSLFNVAYNPVFGWASMATDSLEKQVLIPLFNTQPPEMGLSQSNDAAIPNSNVISSEEVIQRLQKDRHYQNQFNKAFGQEATIDIANVAKAIAAYERTLISGNSAYDRFVFFDEQDALSKEQKAGMQLFFSARVGCSNCHGGFNFSGPVVYEGSIDHEPEFHNTFVASDKTKREQGLLLETGKPEDINRFRAPTLRNIAMTAPYMHDGSIANLREVILHYSRISKTNLSVSAGETAALSDFELSEYEIESLVSFLESLTGSLNQ